MNTNSQYPQQVGRVKRTKTFIEWLQFFSTHNKFRRRKLKIERMPETFAIEMYLLKDRENKHGKLNINLKE